MGSRGEEYGERDFTHFEIQEWLEGMQDLVTKNTLEAKHRQKKLYDCTAQEVELKSNDKVLHVH